MTEILRILRWNWNSFYNALTCFLWNHEWRVVDGVSTEVRPGRWVSEYACQRCHKARPRS